jgi:hypothetical protein
MLDGLMIVVLINCRIHRVLRVLHILLHYELLPDGYDFREETASLLDRILLSKELSHIVVAAAQENALWPMLLALEEDTLREFLKGLLVSFWFILSKE